MTYFKLGMAISGLGLLVMMFGATVGTGRTIGLYPIEDVGLILTIFGLIIFLLAALFEHE